MHNNNPDWGRWFAIRKLPVDILIKRSERYFVGILGATLLYLLWVNGIGGIGDIEGFIALLIVAGVLALLHSGVFLMAQLWWEYRHSGSSARRWLVAAPLLALLNYWLIFHGFWTALFSPVAIALNAIQSALEALFDMLIQLMVLVVIAGIAIVTIKRWNQESEVSVERPDLLTDSGVLAAVRHTASQPSGVLAGEINGELLHVTTQDRACVIGPPGTGKTAFLVSQVLDWAESGRSFVVNDIKPEIYGIVRERLESQGYKLLCINPTGRCGDHYNPLGDLGSPEAVGELAAALIPSENSEDAVFNESARDLLDAVISHLRETSGASLPSVRDYVSTMPDHEELLRDLTESPSHDARDLARGLQITANNDRLMGSIFATFQANLRFLRFPAIRAVLERSDFSLADLKHGRVGLFLQFEETQQQTTARLFSVMMGHVLRFLIEHTDRDPVLLLLDEIGNAPTVAGLVQKLNTIRSRKLPTWLFFQSREQMQPYGQKSDEGANIIMGACSLHMVFRLNDNATAEWVSDKIGSVERLMESTSRTQEAAALFARPSFTESKTLQREPVIFPHQLQRLAPSESVNTYHGLAWRGRATPYYRRWPEFAGVTPDTARPPAFESATET